MRHLLIFCLFVCPALLHAEVKPSKILTIAATEYDPAIPTPREYFGFDPGERHLLHHELVGYLNKLAEVSPRVTIEEYARSHGGRPLVMLTITGTDNRARLEAIRSTHRAMSDSKIEVGTDAVTIDELPAIIQMGYGVHGDEPSASNVTPLVAYHLAAGTGEDHEALLRELVVLIDPCLNPDGHDRFANWSNNHRGRVPNADPADREHLQDWPGGRTNYYWFDLNRDWLPAVHPESRGRLKMYHAWKPNVVLDYHEMGTNSTYFFQPGAPKRYNPLTPKKNAELTNRFGAYHGRALDAIGSLYFTGETFDDFYPGKGSTYPDLHGAVGILFEQASARGVIQEGRNGTVSLPFAMRNHFATSLSSLKATRDLRPELFAFKQESYREGEELAKSGPSAYVVACPEDPVRLHEFLTLLDRHDIKAYRLTRDMAAGEERFDKLTSFVIPANQPEVRFLRTLFERRTEFEENIFYDVSGWTLPLAYHIRTGEWSGNDSPESFLGAVFEPDTFPGRSLTIKENDFAYVVNWTDRNAPSVLHQLQKAGVSVRVATEPFEAESDGQIRAFDYGSIVVPLGTQPEKRAIVQEILRDGAEAGVGVFPLRGGLTAQGIDLGSPGMPVLEEASVALITGSGASGYEAGEVWHLFDQHLGMPITQIDADRLGRADLSRYTTVVVVSGSYSSVGKSGVDKLKQFVQEGGTIVGTSSAASWLNSQGIVSVPFRKESDKKEVPERKPFAEAKTDAALNLIRGAIFQTHVDHTHPIGYGFVEGQPLPVIRSNRLVIDPSKNPYATPVVYTDDPVLSGYVSAENRERLAGSASVLVIGSGRGRVVIMVDNPNFRGFWPATSRLFLNATFFGPLIRNPSVAE